MNIVNIQQEITWTKNQMIKCLEDMVLHTNKAKLCNEKAVNCSKILDLYSQKLRTLENKLKNQELIVN